MLVPGARATVADHWDELAVRTAGVQAEPFNEQYTAPTATLSVALTVTVVISSVNFCLAFGVTMLNVGLMISMKFARSDRLVAMMNCRVAPLVSNLPEPSVQLVNANP